MPKISKRTNYSVSVEPHKPWFYDANDLDELMKSRCDEMVAQIRRHIDDVAWVGVLWETEETCSFCGAVWTEECDNFNGGCCDKDIENCPDKIEKRAYFDRYQQEG